MAIEGLDKRRQEGLDILNSAASPRPVQIMRQTIPNLDMGNISKLAYHRYKGLSSLPKSPGDRRDISDTKYSIYKHYISKYSVSKHHMFDMRDIRFGDIRFDMKV